MSNQIMTDYQCQQCGKTFGTAHGLKVHQSRTRHRGGERVAALLAEHQPRSLRQNGLTEIDRMPHEEPTKFCVCPQCGTSIVRLIKALK